MPGPDLKTIERLADDARNAKPKLYKLAQERRVPGQKVGKHWRFSREAVDVWLRAEPPSEPKTAQGDSDAGSGHAR